MGRGDLGPRDEVVFRSRDARFAMPPALACPVDVVAVMDDVPVAESKQSVVGVFEHLRFLPI